MNAPTLWSQNALWPGAALGGRIKDQLPDLREVLLMDELDLQANGPKQLPAAVVFLHRMRPTSSGPQHAVAALAQEWVVALAVRSARQDTDRNSSVVGGLIPAAVKAVQGWVPPGQQRAFSWVPGLVPNYGRDISYYPLVFSIQVVTA
jgi:hypothetical protein